MTLSVESPNQRLQNETIDQTSDEQTDLYQGSIPTFSAGFLSSAQIEKLLSAQSDAISLSNADAAARSGSLRTQPKPTTHKAEKKGGAKELSNYIENTGDSPSSTNSPDSTGSTGSTGNASGGEMSGEDLLAWLEESLFDFIKDLLSMEDEIMVLNEDGYYEIDEQVLEAYYRKVTSFCAARLLFALIFDTKVQAQKLLYETYNPKDPDNNNDMEENAENKPLSFMESVAKGNEMYQSVMTEFMTQLIQSCMTKNLKIYNARCKDYKDEASEWHDKYIPFCSDTEEYLDNVKAETEDFEGAMKSMMNDLRDVMEGISSVFGPLNSGFMKALDGIEKNIEDIIPEIPDYDEVSGGAPLWLDILGFLGPDALLYAGIRLILGAAGVGDPEYDGSYIDVNALRNAFADVRKDLVGVMSVLYMKLQCLTTLEDAKAQIYEGFNNRKFVENRTSLLAQSVESEAQHQIALFDRLTETVISTAKLRNQVVYINKQIQKAQKPWTRVWTTAASSLQVVAVVLAVLGCIFSWTGIGAVIAMIGIALMAAISAYMASRYANDAIKDAYQPDENEFVENKEKAEAENKRNNTLQDLQNAQSDIMNDLNNATLLNKTNDGYLSMEYGLVADKYRQFISQQNLMRILFEIQEIQQSLQQAIRATYTGISGPKRNFMLSNVLEMQLGQGRSDFARLVANVKDCGDAYNMEYQQEEQVYNAGITLAWSCGLAVAGGCLGAVGGGLGIQIGVALGQAIGNIIGQLGANYGWWGKGGSYGVEFNPDKGNLHRLGKKASSLAEQVEFEETQIYADAFEHGTCDAGDGYEAVDNKNMAQLQSRLLGVANVRALISAVSQLTQQLKSMITASYGNVTVEEVDILTPAMKAQFEASLKVFSYVKDAIQEHVTVQNRARDAEIEVGKSWAKFALNVATAIIGAAVGLGSTSTGFTSLIPALISIENSLVDLISGIIHSRPEYGELSDQTKNFDDKDVDAKNEGKRLNERGAEMDALAEIDEQANSLGFDDGMFESVGGGHISISSGELALANSKLRSLMRVAEMIKEIQKTQAKVMADIIAVNTGVMEPESTLFDNMTNNYKAMMTEILQSKFAALQAYAQRTNQIADQERSMWQAVTSLVMEAAITALSQSISNNQKETQTIAQRGQDSPTGNSNSETKEMADLQASSKNMKIAEIALQALRPWVESLAGAIYDDAAHSHDTSRSEKQISTKQSAVLADKNAEGLAALDAMETEELAANLEAGQIELDMEALQVDARLNEEIGQSVMSSAKSYSSLVKNAVDLAGDDNPIDQLIQFNLLRDDILNMQIDTQDAIFNPETAAQYQTALTQLQDAVAKFNEDPNQENTTGLQLAYADFISSLGNIMPELNKILASLQEMQRQTDTMEEQRTQILGEEATEPTPEELEADQGLVSNTEISARIVDLRHKIDRMKAILAQISDPTTNPEEIPALLQELEAISTEVQEAQSSIQSGFQNAEVMVDAAAACVSQNISEALTAQFDAQLKEKTGDRRIEDLSPEELRGLYQDLRESQFSQSVILRNASRTLQNVLQKILNGTQMTAAEHARAAEALATMQDSTELSEQDRQLLEYAKTALNAEGEISEDTRIGVNGTLARLGSIQGECQQKIQNFNRLIGQIRGLLKDNHGMSDTEIDTFLAVGVDTPMPESVIAPSSAPAQPAQPAAVVTAPPAQPQLDSNTQALLALAESIANSTPIIDEQNGTVQVNGEVHVISAVVESLQGLDQSQLNPQQRAAVAQALVILQPVEPEIEIDPVVSATVTSSAAAEEAPQVKVAENEETEEDDEQLEDLLEGLFKGLGELEGSFREAERTTSGAQLALLDEMSRETVAEVRA